MGDCQNYGPFLGPYYNTGPNTGPSLGDPKRDHNFDNPPYTFNNAADAPSTSSAPRSSGDPQRKPEPPQGTSTKHRVLNRSQGHLSVCLLTLGHWERSRKRSTPQCFHHLLDWDATCAEHKRDPTRGNLSLHFLSNISAHVLTRQETSTIRQGEREVLSNMAG